MKKVPEAECLNSIESLFILKSVLKCVKTFSTNEIEDVFERFYPSVDIEDRMDILKGLEPAFDAPSMTLPEIIFKEYSLSFDMFSSFMDDIVPKLIAKASAYYGNKGKYLLKLLKHYGCSCFQFSIDSINRILQEVLIYLAYYPPKEVENVLSTVNTILEEHSSNAQVSDTVRLIVCNEQTLVKISKGINDEDVVMNLLRQLYNSNSKFLLEMTRNLQPDSYVVFFRLAAKASLFSKGDYLKELGMLGEFHKEGLALQAKNELDGECKTSTNTKELIFSRFKRQAELVLSLIPIFNHDNHLEAFDQLATLSEFYVKQMGYSTHDVVHLAATKMLPHFSAFLNNTAQLDEISEETNFLVGLAYLALFPGENHGNVATALKQIVLRFSTEYRVKYLDFAARYTISNSFGMSAAVFETQFLEKSVMTEKIDRIIVQLENRRIEHNSEWKTKGTKYTLTHQFFLQHCNSLYFDYSREVILILLNNLLGYEAVFFQTYAKGTIRALTYLLQTYTEDEEISTLLIRLIISPSFSVGGMFQSKEYRELVLNCYSLHQMLYKTHISSLSSDFQDQVKPSTDYVQNYRIVSKSLVELKKIAFINCRQEFVAVIELLNLALGKLSNCPAVLTTEYYNATFLVNDINVLHLSSKKGLFFEIASHVYCRLMLVVSEINPSKVENYTFLPEYMGYVSRCKTESCLVIDLHNRVSDEQKEKILSSTAKKNIFSLKRNENSLQNTLKFIRSIKEQSHRDRVMKKYLNELLVLSKLPEHLITTVKTVSEFDPSFLGSHGIASCIVEHTKDPASQVYTSENLEVFLNYLISKKLLDSHQSSLAKSYIQSIKK